MRRRRLFLAWVVVLAACGGTASLGTSASSGDPPTPTPASSAAPTPTIEAGPTQQAARVVLAENEGSVFEIRAANGFIYWAMRDRFGQANIRRMPADGSGSPTTVVADVGFFALDGDRLYYFDKTGTEIHSSTALLATTTSATALAVQGGFVYWAADTGIERVATTGGSVQPLGFDLPMPTSIAVDGTNVYWTEKSQQGGGLNWMSVTGGHVSSDDLALISAGLTLRDGRATWVDSTPAIRTRLLAGGAETTIPIAARGSALAFDDAAIFFTTATGVSRVAFDGTQMLPVSIDKVSVLDVDANALWVGTSDGAIMKLAKDGSAASLPVHVPSPPDAACPVPSVGTAAELALTPRADPELERLALQLDTTKLTATQSNYDRVVRDVGVIRAAYPDLQPTSTSYGTWIPDPSKLAIEVMDSAFVNGDYPSWDCLNSFYGITVAEQGDYDGSATFYLSPRGVLQAKLLFPLYESLPAVTQVGGIQVSVIPEDIPAQICVRDSGSTWDYEFEAASYTSPVPNSQPISWFSLDAAGAITTSGSNQDGGTPPWRCPR